MNEKGNWRERADALGDEMEKYAEDYKCKKCNEFYCSHMLKARAQKYRKQCDTLMSELIETTFA